MVEQLHRFVNIGIASNDIRSTVSECFSMKWYVFFMVGGSRQSKKNPVLLERYLLYMVHFSCGLKVWLNTYGKPLVSPIYVAETSMHASFPKRVHPMVSLHPLLYKEIWKIWFELG